MPTIDDDGAEAEEINPVAFFGDVQMIRLEAGSESWFSVPDCVGITGAGCEPECGCAMQQPAPARQHEWLPAMLPAALWQHCGSGKAVAGVGAKGIHTSNRLNKMANNRFTDQS